MAWTVSETPSVNRHEPVLFASANDPLGASFVTAVGNSNANDVNPHEHQPHRKGDVGMVHGHRFPFPSIGLSRKRSRPSLVSIILSLESNAARQQALQYILSSLYILCAREVVVAALRPHSGDIVHNLGESSSDDQDESVEVVSTEGEQVVGDCEGGGEAPADEDELVPAFQSSPDSDDVPCDELTDGE